MRKIDTVLAATLALGLAGTGYLAAQPGGGAPTPAPAPAPKPEDKLPDITVSGETRANLSPRAIVETSTKLIAEMGGMHLRVLELQRLARKDKDVIKLNCVNEKLLAVKQLLNLADEAKNEITEAVAGGDRDAQAHQHGKVVLAHERARTERDEAEGCIGDELIFVGPTQVDFTGPDIPDDPTDDPDDPYSDFSDDFEHANNATPYS